MTVQAPEATPGAAPEPAPQPTPTAPATPEPQAPVQPPAEPAPPPAGQEPAQPAGSVDELPPWAQKEFRKLRDENASSRVKAKEAADAVDALRAEQERQRDGFARALGLKTDEPPTPEQLTEQLGAMQAERDTERSRAREAAVKLAVLQAAPGAQADGPALLDSVKFLATIAGLDPAAADFAQRVSDAIGEFAAESPRYKLTPPVPAPTPPAPPAQPSPPSSGPGQFTGPPNAPRQWTEEDVANAAPGALQDAINKGLLVNLGFGASRKSRR